MNAETQATSIWIATTPTTSYSSLSRDIDVDTVVVGGGIAGISAAHLLKEKGQRVALIESERIVEGTTGNTTAKVTSLHGLKYASLLTRYGESGAKIYGDANQAAIDRIEEIVNRYNIDCDFLRLPAYTYAQSAEDSDKVRAEAKAAKSLGLPASYIDDVPLPYETFGAVMFDNQAQFHVRKYLLRLAEMIDGNGSFVFEHTKALDIRSTDNSCQVVTDKGTVTARDIVVATHAPFYDPDEDYKDLVEFKDYALGLLIDEETPQGEFFSTGREPHSIRYQPTPEGDIIIVGGKSAAEMEATTPKEAFQLVKEDYSNKFTIKRVAYEWFTEDYSTKDGASYIGQLSRNNSHIYVATGFNGWGMTNGVVAGMILSDRITGQHNEWSDFFDRFKREEYRLRH
jgi:glycine/D-amino acid oxidase-like deaminating enzyme